jgi:iron(III) transport system substrate-binding protein
MNLSVLRGPRIVLAGILAAHAVSAFSRPAAAAEPQSVADIANYTGTDRQSLLEAGARKEGSLMVYMTGTQIQPLIQRFTQKYPYVKVQFTRDGSVEIAQRVLQEYTAGVHLVDAFELADEGLIVPRDAGMLQPFVSPEEANYEKDSIEPQSRWASVREGYTGVGFNTQKISVGDAPKTYKDMLDPKWKGRMAISGSPSTAGNWVGAMLLTQGADYVRALGAQNMRIFQMDQRAISNLMISGEVEISPTTYLSHVLASRANGAPLAWNAPGPVPVLDTSAAIAVMAPHPHAAMLFIDFLLSKEGQLMYRDLGYASARLDMPAGDLPVVEKVFVASRPNYLQEFETWVALFRSAFGHGATTGP